jgi:nicotinamide-nucleotide amidase
VVAVGDELLLGDIVNGNAAWLGARLAEVGTPVVHSSAVGDDVARIVTALRRAMEDATSCSPPVGSDRRSTTSRATPSRPSPGCAGPGSGARAVAARALRRLRHLRAAGQVLRQADVPRGATVLDNPVGSAPGLRVEVDGRLLIALPARRTSSPRPSPPTSAPTCRPAAARSVSPAPCTSRHGRVAGGRAGGRRARPAGRRRPGLPGRRRCGPGAPDHDGADGRAGSGRARPARRRGRRRAG